MTIYSLSEAPTAIPAKYYKYYIVYALEKLRLHNHFMHYYFEARPSVSKENSDKPKEAPTSSQPPSRIGEEKDSISQKEYDESNINNEAMANDEALGYRKETIAALAALARGGVAPKEGEWAGRLDELKLMGDPKVVVNRHQIYKLDIIEPDFGTIIDENTKLKFVTGNYAERRYVEVMLNLSNGEAKCEVCFNARRKFWNGHVSIILANVSKIFESQPYHFDTWRSPIVAAHQMWLACVQIFLQKAIDEDKYITISGRPKGSSSREPIPSLCLRPVLENWPNVRKIEINHRQRIEWVNNTLSIEEDTFLDVHINTKLVTVTKESKEFYILEWIKLITTSRINNPKLNIDNVYEVIRKLQPEITRDLLELIWKKVAEFEVR